jgi:DNA-binding CsgD family transcriptional regulator
MQVTAFFERCGKETTAGDLFGALEHAAAAAGFDYVAYGALSNCARLIARAATAPAVALNYPRDWQEHYFHQGYQNIDPVVTRTCVIHRPYTWHGLRASEPLSSAESRIFDEAASAGLRCGASVPLHGLNGSVAVLSFAAKHAGVADYRSLPHLNAIAAQFHVAHNALLARGYETQTPVLTPRERECLAWAAQGKSSWDIGMLLSVSESTVNFHIKNALHKLDTSSRIVAVVKAIRLGLIQL